jgi:hypothetical protein
LGQPGVEVQNVGGLHPILDLGGAVIQAVSLFRQAARPPSNGR